MSDLDALLEVQERDTAVDRLLHRRATLDDRQALHDVEERLASVQARLDEGRARSQAVASRQAALESEVASLDRRIADIDRRLYSGQVSASRELQAMVAEIDSLKSRRSAVEDEVLEAMEEGEPLAEAVASLEGDEAELAAAAERLRSSIAGAEAVIDAEVDAEHRARAETAARVPAELLATYERLRARLGGVGAARLVGSSCSGCHLTLPASELARIRREPPDTVVLCDQCGRILVRG